MKIFYNFEAFASFFYAVFPVPPGQTETRRSVMLRRVFERVKKVWFLSLCWE